MPPDGIGEPVDIAANGLVGFVAGVEDGPPDELGFQGFEERLHHGVVVTICLRRPQGQIFSGSRACTRPWISAGVGSISVMTDGRSGRIRAVSDQVDT